MIFMVVENFSSMAACTTIWAPLREWRHRARSRAELQSLGRREIANFCPGFTEAEQEARKPFWCAQASSILPDRRKWSRAVTEPTEHLCVPRAEPADRHPLPRRRPCHRGNSADIR